MRLILAVLLLSSCAGSGTPASFGRDSCAEQFRQCTRTAGDEQYCVDQRDVCHERRSAIEEERGEKQRRYEDFKRERAKTRD